MNEFFKMDVFFVVATAGLTLLILGGAVIFWYAIRILRDIEHVTDAIVLEGDAVLANLEHIRATVSDSRFVKYLLKLFGTIEKKRKK